MAGTFIAPDDTRKSVSALGLPLCTTRSCGARSERTTHRARSTGRRALGIPFGVEEDAFLLDAAPAVAAELAIGSDHAMARDDERRGVLRARARDRPYGARCPECFGD